jgi:uncharacterized protein YukE
MAGGIVQYTVEIVEASQRILKTASELNRLMGELMRDQKALEAVSTGLTATAFSEVQTAFNKSGLTNSATFQAVAKAANTAHTQMTDFDRHMANRLRA